MNTKILTLAAALIATATATSSGAQAQSADQRAEPGRQSARPGAANVEVSPGAVEGLVSRVPQTQGGTAPNSSVVPPNLPPGLVPAPGRDAAPQLSTGGGTQLQQPGQTTTR